MPKNTNSVYVDKESFAFLTTDVINLLNTNNPYHIYLSFNLIHISCQQCQTEVWTCDITNEGLSKKWFDDCSYYLKTEGWECFPKKDGYEAVQILCPICKKYKKLTK